MKLFALLLTAVLLSSCATFDHKGFVISTSVGPGSFSATISKKPDQATATEYDVTPLPIK